MASPINVAADAAHMQAALSLASRGLGRTWPNPSVGCVIVKDHVVVGRGRTADGGRPHGETQALAMAGSHAQGATAYVTLEPCSHFGQTPPCAQALIDAGLARVVVATGDPDPRVSGRGLAMLEAAGIAVTFGVLQAQADALNQGFFLTKTQSRPLVTVKLATTMDGNIASASGASQWITGPSARAQGHLLRSQHDAVLVGMGTVLADDPDLTCRLPGLEDRPPVSVIAGSRPLPPDCNLVQAASHRPVWLLTDQSAAPKGVKIIPTPRITTGLDLAAGLKALASHGITRLMVEGGGAIVASLLRSRLVDQVVWFRAPSVMGGDGLSAIQAMGVSALADMPHFTLNHIRPVGRDMMETYTRT